MAHAARPDLKDLTVLVAGACCSPGRDVALAFARRGASLVLFDWNRLPWPAPGAVVDSVELLHLAAEVSAAGGRALTLWGDIRNEADVSRAVDKAVLAFGSLDVVFNAMQVPVMGVCWDPFDEGWDTVIDVNLKGAWLLAKWAVPEMRRQGRGLLVNNAWDSGLDGGCLWGVEDLSRSLGLSTGSQDVHVRALAGRAPDVDPGTLVVAWAEAALGSAA